MLVITKAVEEHTYLEGRSTSGKQEMDAVSLTCLDIDINPLLDLSLSLVFYVLGNMGGRRAS